MWLSLIKEVSDISKLNWAQCWDLTIYEFFNYVSFCREYNRKQYEMQKRIAAQYKQKV